MRYLVVTLSLAVLAMSSACAPIPKSEINSVSAASGPPSAKTPADIGDLFTQYDLAELEMSPIGKAYRGIRDEDYGKWDDPSDEAAEAEFALLNSALIRMRADYDPDELSPEDALSYRLFESMAARRSALHPFREYGFVFDHRRGAHTSLPAFLINIHRVSEPAHAEAYIGRIAGIGSYLDALTAESRERADAGVMPPDWVYPYVIADLESLISAGDGNAVLVDFAEKVDALGLTKDETASLKARARDAWNASALPAYIRVITEMRRQQINAPSDDGIWRLPEGERYYAALLTNYTTTDLTADEIHAIGLREVGRIHGEMRAIMDKVGFKGDLQEFFQYTRTDDRFFHTSREDYIAEAEAVLERMEAKLPEYFGTLPKAPMVIKPVEAFREKSAGKAFYQSPAPDGSRPGTYYVNLYNLRDMSRNELEALAYHEGVPGHHLQRTIQTELDDAPPFRRFGGVTAYSEGWGLYSEELGKDMGFYTDPFSDFGRLGMELWRAARLVVDTGIHHKRWTREEAISYLSENTPNPEGDVEKAIERYITTPGQATAYMIGKLKIVELRDRAMRELGEKFDWRAFHDAVLLNGPVPLEVLEDNVNQWIEERRR